MHKCYANGNVFERPAQVTVDLEKLARNVKRVKKALGSNCRLMAVVKAEAYGHGAIPVARVALESGAELLGVAMLEEGVALREAGIKAPIAVLYPEPAERAKHYARYRLEPTICSREFAEAWRSNVRDTNSCFFVKLETGMHRYGLTPPEIVDLLHSLQLSDRYQFEGVLSHFATSGDHSTRYSRQQLKEFQKGVAYLTRSGFPPPIRSIANSGALLDLPESFLDMARIGILLFGLSPTPDRTPPFPVEPILSITSQIAFLREVPAGTSISYGRTFITRHRTVVATIPLGFADGFPRQLSNTGKVLIRSQHCPILGRICMDAFMVDVTGLHNVRMGDEVVLIGKQGDRTIGAWDVACSANTTAYEITSRLGTRLPVVYRGKWAKKN